MNWPTDAAELVAAQRSLAEVSPPPWTPPERYLVAGVWICFPRGLSGPGSAGDPAWTAAVVMDGRLVVGRQTGAGAALSSYVPGLLALRIGPLLEDVVRRLTPQPDVLLLDATGRDHPRRAGLALQLGAVLDLPTVGVTHRPLIGTGERPVDQRGSTAPVYVDGEEVASWLRTRAGARAVVVHPGWRTDLADAVGVVASSLAGRRTPEPLREARHSARLLRRP